MDIACIFYTFTFGFKKDIPDKNWIMKYFLSILLFLPSFVFGQNDLESQVPKDKKYDSAEVVDERFGITMYEPLNMVLSGDSVRMENGYAISNWKEDYYTTGALLHRGYYVDGQLKVYRNFYPNGNIEREFRNLDTFRSVLKLYYPSGKLKSEVKYLEGEPMVWTDFFENGNMEFYEEFHKSMLYHISKKHFYESGQVKSNLELVNKKKLEFSQNDYYSNGNPELTGALKYSKSSYDYFKVGKWKYYKEDGSPLKDEEYEYGRIVKTKTY